MHEGKFGARFRMRNPDRTRESLDSLNLRICGFPNETSFPGISMAKVFCCALGFPGGFLVSLGSVRVPAFGER